MLSLWVDDRFAGCRYSPMLRHFSRTTSCNHHTPVRRRQQQGAQPGHECKKLRPGMHDELLLSQSLVDADKGFGTYRMTWSELPKMARGQSFRLLPLCFVVQPSGKKRIIDDAAGGGGQPELSSDVLCNALTPAQYVAVAGWTTRSDWDETTATDTFESGGEAWPNAYRHSPISREESSGCLVALWHHEWRQPVACLSGFHVLRQCQCSRLGELVRQSAVSVLPAQRNSEHSICIREAPSHSDSRAFSRFGSHDLSQLVQTGVATLWTRQQLIDKIATTISESRSSASLPRGVASKIHGMMNFLEQVTYGRIGANGLATIKERHYQRTHWITQQIFGVVLKSPKQF